MQISHPKLLRLGNPTHGSGGWGEETGREVKGSRGTIGPAEVRSGVGSPSSLLSRCLSQLAAQVLEDLDDEDIGFGLVDEKKDSAVAKKLGKRVWRRCLWWTRGPTLTPPQFSEGPALTFFPPSLLKLLHFCVSKCSQFESSAFLKILSPVFSD